MSTALSALSPSSGVSALASTASTSSSSDSASITANEFLTLLVTELKNQDPTANSDPNDYINQLVAVNSLQQLIAIHETLSSAIGDSSSSASAQAVQSFNSASGVSTGSGVTNQINNGNLSLPNVTPAADRVAQALSGVR